MKTIKERFSYRQSHIEAIRKRKKIQKSTKERKEKIVEGADYGWMSLIKPQMTNMYGGGVSNSSDNFIFCLVLSIKCHAPPSHTATPVWRQKTHFMTGRKSRFHISVYLPRSPRCLQLDIGPPRPSSSAWPATYFNP